MNVENAASIEEMLTWGWMGRLWNVMGWFGGINHRDVNCNHPPNINVSL